MFSQRKQRDAGHARPYDRFQGDHKMGKLDTGRDFITDNLSPLNAVVFFTTGIVVPVLDLLRPVVPLLNYFAGIAVIGFCAVLVAKLLGKPRPIPTGFVATVGVCCAIFAAGAYASSKHAAGFIASKEPALAQVQASMLGQKLDTQTALLADIKSGKSDDPRVALKNMGVAWDFTEFRNASQRGDLKVMQLFLEGGMTTTLPTTSTTLPELAITFNHQRVADQLALFAKHGFDLKAPTTAAPDQPSNLYAVARMKGNTEAAHFLETVGFSSAEYDSWHKTTAKKTDGIYKF